MAPPKPPFTNRLIHEKSPYLLQHAHNPVDWHPWGTQAFDLAKSEDKPIFLSIGYATCHWCHVMERESFENAEIARMMNETFVNIKVDREELPEVDSIYMEFAQALMSSSGGWPLNLVLTSDLKPFFAVTYLPPVNRRGLIGMPQFIQRIHQLWKGSEREQLMAQAEKIVEVFQQSTKSVGDEIPLEEQISQSVEMLYELIDPVFGGFKGEPKFPLGYQSLFLLKFARKHAESRALFCAELSLDRMLQGGIYDQLGGGFARYAVDERWLIPHFEKMLYDNAILAEAYLESYRYIKKKEYAQAVEKTLDYILREMTHPDGGFYSAEDADSDGHEGMFYTWELSEIFQSVPKEEAQLFCQFYGVTQEGNFEGRNVLHVQMPLQEFAEMQKIPLEQLQNTLNRVSAQLFEKRGLRPRPFKDDKILCSWNGLMIDAMIKGAVILNKSVYRQAALKAADFLETRFVRDHHLFRRWREDEARFSGGLDDYAFVIKGLLTLFESGCGTKWLKWAMDLSEVLRTEFKEPGGAFYYASDNTLIPIRRCEYYDGAEPSGNAVHAENLIRLYQLTQDPKFLEQAEDIFKASKHYIDHYPPGACYHLMALQRYYDKKAETVVIVLDEKQNLETLIQEQLKWSDAPHRCVIWKRAHDSLLTELIPSLVDKNLVDGQTAVYICTQERCAAPLIGQEEILKAL
ncbi:MAG: thioredoxin domain-containing protein [Rhabdochlamydiaceae bacterium]|nr:thioredoxin domain-containing protein [Rhabdochlamydiaceae bacterium]